MLFGQSVSLVCSTDQWRAKKCRSRFPEAATSGELRSFAEMRQRHTVATSSSSSFHHPALTTCSAPLPSGKKYVAVRYLVKDDFIFFVVDVKGKGQEIFEDACKYAGLQDTELFGLACVQEGEYVFVDLSLKISKYAVKSWKTSLYGVSNDGQPLLTLHLKVKHYVDCHFLISEKVARHHYYMQLRDNVKNYMQPLSEEKSFLLAALALQADLGNYNAQRHVGKYFEITNYFPSWIVAKIGEDYIIRNIPALHKDNVGLSRGEAQVSYIKEASDVTASHNLHFYKMRRRKGKAWNMAWLGIKDSGIYIYEQQTAAHIKTLLSTFLWCDIAKLHFEKKKFEIQSEGSPDYRTFTYYVYSEDMAKHLLWMCRTTHHFHMANEVRVQDLKKLELDGGKSYKENYIYTDKKDLALWEKQNAAMRDIKALNMNGDVPRYLGENAKPRARRKESCNSKPSIHRLKEKLDCSAPSLRNRSMEVLPLTNGCIISPDVRYKSQSIACFRDYLLSPCSNYSNVSSSLWSPTSNSSLSTTPTSTLMSRSSCASYTDSACSSLSLTSSSTVKANSSSITSTIITKNQITDISQWIKCDSFEELNIGDLCHESKSLPHKVCISTFKDSHVRTASLYDAALLCSKLEPQVSRKPSQVATRMLPSSSSSTSVASPSAVYVASPSAANISSTASRDFIHQASDQGHVFGQTYQKCSRKQSLKSKVISSSLTGDATDRVSKSTENLSESQPLRPHPAGRHYEQNTTAHSRTVTRIGISSLSREVRLPLSLYNGRGKMTACGSEPNLHSPLSNVDYEEEKQFPEGKGSSTPIKSADLHRPNSKSEMCLNIIGQNPELYQIQLDFRLQDAGKHLNNPKESSFLSENDSEKCLIDGDNFPCIPPPPAYRNSSDNSLESGQLPASSPLSETEDTNSSEVQSNVNGSLKNETEAHRELRSSLSLPPDVLDLQKLREKSRDLDLPLISALCNDRSLLMLPKTVPTCSRQRHLGNKDPLRFARGYATAPVNGNVADSLPKEVRPMSWHMDSPISSMWSENPNGEAPWCGKGTLPNHCNGSIGTAGPRQNLPPTILTSFGKTGERQSPRPDNNYNSSDYRLNKIQMIPTKLLSGNFSNGRLYQKGNSS